jgi:hypothetical protein
VDKEEFNRVDDLDEAKEVWTTLWMAHEGLKPVRMAKIEMLEGQLNRSIMLDDKTPQDMFNRLKKMVNKVKALGSKKWTDRLLTEWLMRAYTPMNYNMVALIHQVPTYKFSKGDKKFNTKSTTKRTSYNCGMHVHFIAKCPFEHRDDDDDKKKSKFYKKDKGYKRNAKPYKK